MKKPALHWQILIALILAVVYGLIFPTSYRINDKQIQKLEKKLLPSPVTTSLDQVKDKTYTSQHSFQEELTQVLDPEAFRSYFPIIQKAAYYNPAVGKVSWLGDLFLRALKMLIIPLIVSSLISGITNIGSGQNLGRLGLKTISYYMITSTLAILTGLLLVNVIRPGIGADMNFIQKVEGLVEKQRDFRDLLIQIVPENVFQSIVENDMLPVIFFSILFGFFITRVNRPAAEFLTSFFNSVFEVMMKITMFIILFTPLGIFGIVSKVVADQDNLIQLVSRMGLYMGTVLLGLIFHSLVILPLLVKFIGRSKPYRHFSNMSTPLLTAFSTSSSGATLPLTMTAVEENSGVSNKISSFTLPLGATINMDGTALYECVAALFIAQAYGVDLSVGQQVIVVITALLASIGAAGIPMAGLVMITVILTAVNLPLEGVGLILAVDRILDMFRTATNVWSDSCGAVIIARSEGEALKI
ncbi:MAG: cation:dicarboxylase symporter family transporter [Bacteroidales bacterium]|nr:cation:dicarboxylase symporter family transporter [Bacteroidales bacterium]